LEDFQFTETGPVRLANIFITLTLGWPLYLFFNASGRKYERFANHFDPYSPIYSKRERLEIVISDAALIAVVGGLTGLAQSFGWLWLLKVTPSGPQIPGAVLVNRFHKTPFQTKISESPSPRRWISISRRALEITPRSAGVRGGGGGGGQ
jgi:hypothetical protein